MVSGLLFKWEDSPALSHHCGFCDRPLSHPGARASCFGTHSEPCARYHQAMFMRLRSHTCHYCRTIDEAHDRRHKKIAGQIRDVYESCGQVDWTIIPTDTEERGRPRVYDTALAGEENDCDPAQEDTATSKRERKDAKSLARAASRTRVISRDEILHVEAVIHFGDSVLSGDDDGPSNAEELEEIDRHLKYNAHVYNSQSDRRALRKFARLPDVDVDFDAEMERIFDVFRITELLQRNTRNRGLIGKELKMFQRLVDELKKAVVDDLVAVKHDTLEIRMRRAGYLRYANKAAHMIVEDRYTDKDWKTGERKLPNTSSSSGIASPDEESISSQSASSESSSQSLPTTSQHGPDLRHLEKMHMRVNGDDGLGEKIIEPYRAPLIPMPTTSSSKQRAVQLKVVKNSVEPSVTTRTGCISKTPQQTNTGTWATVLSRKKPKPPSVKPAWGMTAAGRHVTPSVSPINPWGPEACEISDLRSFGSASVQPPVSVQPPEASTVTASRGPDQFVESDFTMATCTAVGHAIVSQKKTKKYEREARRKAKKAGLQEQALDIIKVTSIDGDVNLTHDTTLVDDEVVAFYCPSEDDSSSTIPLDIILIETAVKTVSSPVADMLEFESCAVVLDQSSSVPLHVTNNTKHMHWLKFKRQFMVDQLTSPLLSKSLGCTHDSTCVYMSNDVLICPFHEPHCSCVDPLIDQCYLTYPCDGMLSTGPYNRLHGEKLLAMYQKDEHFKDRIMLVDSDVVSYFLLDPSYRLKNRNGQLVPKRLATEYDEFADGYRPGPLMEQEKLFEHLWTKNNLIKRQISRNMLLDFQRKYQHTGAPVMCYCHDQMSEHVPVEQVVECAHRDCQTKYFHKSCIKKLGVDKVSHWYCTRCEQKMQSLAYQTLHDMGYDDVPDKEADFDKSMDIIKEKYSLPDSAMHLVRAGIETMGPGVRVAGVTSVNMVNVP